MSVSEQTLNELRQQLRANATFLVPNNRLVLQLNQLLDQVQFAEQFSDKDVSGAVWQTSRALSFEQWFDKQRNTELIRGALNGKQLINAQEEATLWYEIALNSVDAPSLLSVSTAVKEAQNAYALIRDWQLDLVSHRFAFLSEPDARVFYRWAEAFQQLLDERGLICRADAKRELLESATECFGQHIVLTGFYRIAPLQRALLAKYSGEGGSVQQLSLAADIKSIKLVTVSDSEQEYTAAAAWVRQIQSDQPNARIGIMVRDLTQQRQKVERILQRELAAGSPAIDKENPASLYNISAGLSLDKTPIGNTFLDLVEAGFNSLSLSRWQQLLLSGYVFAAVDELGFINRLLSAMYASDQTAFSLLELPRLLAWHQSNPDSLGADQEGLVESDNTSRDLASLRLRKVVEQLRALRRKADGADALPSQWLAELKKMAQTLGWPGQHSLGSNEFQQLGKFEQSIEEFARFDRVLGRVSLPQATAAFTRYCAEVIYHRDTEGDKNALPQVLGLLEASGQSFDYLWLTGMSDRSWPPQNRPNSCIPLALQLEFNMPMASIQGEFDYAQIVTRGFLNSSSQLVISAPQEQDNLPVRLSPLITALLGEPAYRGVDLQTQLRDDSVLSASRQANDEGGIDDSEVPLECIEDFTGQPLLASSADLPGGATMLRDVAVNPLRAYARWRLAAKPLPVPLNGISPAERGQLLHAMLEGIWSELGCSSTLQQISEDKLNELIDRNYYLAAERVFARRYQKPGDRLYALEKKLLRSLVNAWLNLESERPPFTVYATEQSVDTEIGGYRIKGRIDRIDLLESGQLAVLDYKTGNYRVAGVFESPLSEPQLPFYVQALEDGGAQAPIVAIGVAGLKPGYLKFRGLASELAESGDIDGLETLDPERRGMTWHELREFWRDELQALVIKAAEGYAAIDSSFTAVDVDYEPFVRLRFAQSAILSNE